MARRNSAARLLRTLIKAGNAQGRATLKMVDSMLALPKSSRRKRPAKAAAVKAPRVRTPAPVAPGRWLAGQYLGTGQPMRYWLYLPHAVPPDAVRDGLPLVLMLHGCQQTATQFAQGTRMNLVAEKKGYAVLYPQQSSATHPQRCWRWFERATQEGGGDVQPVAALLAQVLAQHAIDRRRIYVCGISAGAGLANIMALNYPDIFAAVGLHSGPVFGAGNGAVGALGVMRRGGGLRTEPAIREVLARRSEFLLMPTILIQGDADTVVHAVNQQQLVEQSLLLNGIPADAPVKVTRRGTRSGHEIRDYLVGKKVLLRVVRIDTLAHAWSGGDPGIAFHAKGPDASRMMLEFFGRHRR
ncbi:poly(hydroxyalkanoate) depolymerase family esterase [Pseudoduganella lurida]|uniref:Poly(Hydroxyalkanoate) depolymerase family esterase n=1 Tax=Pseudoduganella lurida TaxID=1036180 RepID=A0A562QZW6_9BURK|nr:PHB depolymerase family esterase [Pseudoduganella lurida]TWI62123.1 poly(hydroxyalkanoate) depolymerase family esterase [Pseudoduganella lurida]